MKTNSNMGSMDMGTPPSLKVQGQPSRGMVSEKMANTTAAWTADQYAGYKMAPNPVVLKGGYTYMGGK